MTDTEGCREKFTIMDMKVNSLEKLEWLQQLHSKFIENEIKEEKDRILRKYEKQIKFYERNIERLKSEIFLASTTSILDYSQEI